MIVYATLSNPMPAVNTKTLLHLIYVNGWYGKSDQLMTMNFFYSGCASQLKIFHCAAVYI